MADRRDLPAIEGGTPVRGSLLPYGRQTIGEEEERALLEVLRSDFITTGPKVREFEERIAALVGKRYAVAVNSGTAALHCAAFAAGIKEGLEAVTTPNTFLASANCVVYLGGRPVFADIDAETYNIDPAEVRKAVTDRTRAIISVDFAGQPADHEELAEVAGDKGLVHIEDAAHALGAEYKGAHTGRQADLLTLSFHPVKHITTGEGGIVATDDEEMYQNLQTFRTHGMVRDPGRLIHKDEGPWFYEMQVLGFNYRITDLQCALGLAQMPKLEGFIGRRRRIAAMYTEAFSAIEGVVPMTERPDRKSVYHIYVVRFQREAFKVGRKRIFEALRAENIGVNVHYIPVHLQPYYRQRYGHKRGDFPRAEEYYDTAITLPIFPTMTDADVEDVIQAVGKVADHYRA